MMVWSPAKRRFLLVLLFALLVGAYFYFDLGRYLAIEEIKRSLSQLEAWRSAHPFLSAGAYVALYVAVTGLSLPGAVPVSLAGGAIFGLWLGTALVSVGSTLGATLACAASRYLLRDWVQGRFGQRLTRINRGVEQEGGFYLFTLRLIPLFPFFLINLALGLTRMRLWTFLWVSWLGMLPGTLVFVNAGKELGRLDSASGILSPRLLLSFALLGIFPLVARRIIQWYRRRTGHGEI
ncbi:TVP38/TMEM64 family protein [Paucidesulfovibrio longus]|uniref:TVP38/TMEM64 family protein n=1 Tax=Paucidesulfovibrio longus TaxID=889 RepID=UPI0003B76FC4|nr:TVP38/TMEM64 family protein [Paucidesulfovibrio longus]